MNPPEGKLQLIRSLFGALCVFYVGLSLVAVYWSQGPYNKISGLSFGFIALVFACLFGLLRGHRD